jgi:hypothetical protein
MNKERKRELSLKLIRIHREIQNLNTSPSCEQFAGSWVGAAYFAWEGPAGGLDVVGEPAGGAVLSP